MAIDIYYKVNKKKTFTKMLEVGMAVFTNTSVQKASKQDSGMVRPNTKVYG